MDGKGPTEYFLKAFILKAKASICSNVPGLKMGLAFLILGKAKLWILPRDMNVKITTASVIQKTTMPIWKHTLIAHPHTRNLDTVGCLLGVRYIVQPL